MSSKSKTLDQTAPVTKNNVTDRRVVQERGNQILDSVVQTTDDKVVRAALAEARAILNSLTGAATVPVAKMEAAVNKVLALVEANQITMSKFGLQTLEGARADLRDARENGFRNLQLASDTVRQSLTVAQQVAKDQAVNQNKALEILADARAGDYSDVTKTVTAMMMVSLLGALYITRKR